MPDESHKRTGNLMRIATWNLEGRRGNTRKKLEGLKRRMDDIGADIWVLTETDDLVDLHATHPFVAASDRLAGTRSPGDRWTAVWSRYPARAVPTQDSVITACLDIDTPAGPLLVYGTVLPYHQDRGSTGEAAQWSEHYRVIPLQGAEWRELRARYPSHQLCVAGDLNQSRDGRRWPKRGLWYGTPEGRALLDYELGSAGLACLTEEDFVGTGKLKTRSTVVHICADAHWTTQANAGAWEAGEFAGVELSDHNGVYVDLRSNAP